jgi:hypothetical protein
MEGLGVLVLRRGRRLMVRYELNDEDDDGDDDGDGDESCRGIFDHLLLANHTSEVDILILLLALA